MDKKRSVFIELKTALTIDRTAVTSRALYPRKILNYQKGIHSFTSCTWLEFSKKGIKVTMLKKILNVTVLSRKLILLLFIQLFIQLNSLRRTVLQILKRVPVGDSESA